jgi:hypothetical protein
MYGAAPLAERNTLGFWPQAAFPSPKTHTLYAERCRIAATEFAGLGNGSKRPFRAAAEVQPT